MGALTRTLIELPGIDLLIVFGHAPHMTDDKSPLKTDRDSRAWVARLGRESVQSADQERSQAEESERVKAELEARQAPAPAPRELSIAVRVLYYPSGAMRVYVTVQGMGVLDGALIEQADAAGIGQAVSESITAAGLRALVGGP